MKTNQTNKAHAGTDRLPHGLHALDLHSARVHLPLKAIDARFEVAGDCAEVTIEQIFEYEGPNPVDVIYTFPLPEEASVYRCIMTIGDRKVVAVVKSIDDARKDYKQAHQSGRRAALVESVRDNLFELQLGNVQPGDSITISLGFVSPVFGEGPRRRLRIPVCPGIRFIPGKPVGVDGGTDLVPDAARLLPQRIGSNHPDAVAFYCTGTLLHVTGIESPSHDIEMCQDRRRHVVTVGLSEDSEVPDRDFILTWERPCETLALMGSDDPEFLICSFQTPDDFGTMERGARDIHFLLDSSGSMLGVNWNALLEALDLALAALSEADRFSIALFSNTIQTITDGLVAANRSQIRAMMKHLREQSPNGGTQFTRAFEQTIDTAKAARRPVIVVVTDGQFGDEARACAVARDCGIEVHTIGIDANVNETALRKIARRTRGTCSLAVPGENLDEIIHQLMGNLLCPVLERISAGSQWSLVGNPPPVRPGQAALVSLRRNAGSREFSAPRHVKLEMGYSDGSRRRETLDVNITRGMAPTILAAKTQITALLDDDQIKDAVVLACRFNVICEGAAFIAVDEAQKMAVASAELEQPSQVPDMFASEMSNPFLKRSALPDFLVPPALLKVAHKATPIRPNDHFAFMSMSESPVVVPLNHEEDPVNQLLEIASRVTCFDRTAWMELVKDHLIPWACEKNCWNRLARIKRVVCWLARISNVSLSNREIIIGFRALLPSLDGKALEMTKIFILNFKKQNTGKPL